MTLARRITGLAREAGGFTDPTDIASLAAWYDFSDATTMYVDAGSTLVSSDGDLIYQINDKSGHGYHLTQATSGLRPVYKQSIRNGLDVGRFSAASLQKLNVAGGIGTKAAQFTNFSAFASTVVTTRAFVFASANGGATIVYGCHEIQPSATDGAVGYYFGTDANLSTGRSDASVIANGTWAVVADRYTSGTAEELWVDGSTVSVTTTSTTASANTGTTLDFSIGGLGAYGGSLTYGGDIGEVVCFANDLSTDDMTAMNDYMTGRWS